MTAKKIVYSEFFNAYLECATWASDLEFKGPLSPSAINAMFNDCEKFQKENKDDIDGRDLRAGHDFWLTRCGHGAGFWDGNWPEPAATRLTEAAKAFGEADLYRGDDGKIYHYSE